MSKLDETHSSKIVGNIQVINDLVNEFQSLVERPRLHTHAPIDQKYDVKLLGKTTWVLENQFLIEEKLPRPPRIQ